MPNYTLMTNPDRTSWLKSRQDGIGGSDVAAILGDSPWKSPYGLWGEKTQNIEAKDISQNPRVEAGTRLEPLIREWFQDLHPDLYVFPTDIEGSITTFVSKDRPWAMADLDGIAIDLDNPKRKPIVVEIKTAHTPYATEWRDPSFGNAAIPKHYLDQVLHYLSVTGWDEAYVCVLIDGWDLREYHITRDDMLIDSNDAKVDEFWTENVQKRISPPPTTKADGQSIFANHPASQGIRHLTSEGEQEDFEELIDDWSDAKEKVQAAEAVLDAATCALKAAIGNDKGVALDSGTITWVKKTRPKTDTKAMLAEDPDLCHAYDELKAKHTEKIPADGGLRWKAAKQ